MINTTVPPHRQEIKVRGPPPGFCKIRMMQTSGKLGVGFGSEVKSAFYLLARLLP